MNYTQAQIRRFFDTATWERGAAYAREGRVLSMDRDKANSLVKAQVRGSGRNIYRQTIRLTYDGQGTVRSVEGDCSCPVGYNCKHVAAVCSSCASEGYGQLPPFALMPVRELGTKRPPSSGELPAQLSSWLGRLRSAQSQPFPDTGGWPATVRDRLLYIVDVNDNGKLTIETLKGSLLKDGMFSSKTKRYDISRTDSHNAPKFIRQQDLRIISRLRTLGFSQSYSYYGQSVEPVPGEIYALLEMIAETGRGRWRDAHAPALHSGEKREGKLQWQTLEHGIQRLMVTGRDDRKLFPLPLDPPAFIDPETGTMGLLVLAAPAHMVPLLLNAPAIPAEHAPQIMRALLDMPETGIPVPQRIETEIHHGHAPVPVLRLFSTPATRQNGRDWTRETEQLPTLRLSFDYDGRTVGQGPGGRERFMQNGKVITLLRDGDAEQRAFKQLLSAGARFAGDIPEKPGREAGQTDLYFSPDPTKAGFFEPRAFGDDVFQFMTHTLPELKKDGWRVEIAQDWPCRLYDGPVETRSAVLPLAGPAKDDYLSFAVHLQAGDERLDLVPVIRQLIDQLAFLDIDAPDWEESVEAVLEGLTLYPQLKDGRFIPMEASSLIPLLRVFLSALGLLDGFHKAEAGRAFVLAEALQGCGIAFETGPELLALGQKLQALAQHPETEPPPKFRATLRSYQKTGFGWLRALSETGFGGILADDMGLGKTVQTLALLADRHLGEARPAEPSLLVVPTSLVHSWRRQAEQFAPDLKVLILHGPARQKDFGAISEHHVVVTSYPLLSRDHDVLAATQWDIIVLDEAQTIKNPAATIAKRIRDLRSRMRLALTGTPMENSLLDLWALYDWLIPGLLGDRKTFRARFLVPIETQGNARVQAELNARISPFMLRRTKQQVALDLPEKTEITELVTLGDQQAKLYESIRLAMDERVRKIIAERGLAASQITILDALLKLRQICCDPRLLKHETARTVTESAKRARLLELLVPLVAEGRRVLVFSQFVDMLRLIEADIKAQGWRYAWLTGETANRDEVVTGFQLGDIPVFLISLKAGGVGLTLTAADTVILYDPWWNPAVERQAMDRVHRIGQEHKVFVYRLITEGSVEQAIADLQERKQALADALFEGGEHGPLTLDASDIAALFQPLNTKEHSH